jgi:REP element-mobilizing transposase RayT
MPRFARVKKRNGGGFYHLCARISGDKRAYPLQAPQCRRKLIELIEKFSQVYCCQVVAFCIMGNHYHLLVRMDDPCQVDREFLRARASLLYPDPRLDQWSERHWRRFEERVFDVSELMRNIQAAFTRWYNDNNEWRGSFWAGRFKSTLIETVEGVLECAAYIELNPVRAKLVVQPEDYDGSSLFFREMKKDGWLMPLEGFVQTDGSRSAKYEYKNYIYYRGVFPTKGHKTEGTIPLQIALAEREGGYKTRGAFLKRVGYFVDGVVLGSKEYVESHLRDLREQGTYKRRRNAIEDENLGHCVLRPQR